MKSTIQRIMKETGKMVTGLGLAGVLLASPVLVNQANAGNVSTETRMDSKNRTHVQLLKTRTKANYGPFTLTYDINQKKNTPNEVKLWTDAISKGDFTLGLLVEGETDSRKPYADIGVCAGTKVGNKKIGNHGHCPASYGL